MRLSKLFSVLLISATLVAACSVLPKQSPPEKTYDFGPLPSTAAFSNIHFPPNVEVAGVDSAPWLQNRNIYYRFGYLDAARLRSYTRSRWLTPPATLLRERLSDAMAQQDHAAVPEARQVQLNLHLQRFEQVFAAPHRAHVLMQVRASLTNQSQSEVLAQRVFRFTRASKSADAPGAVNAFSAVTDQFLESLTQWLRQVDPKSGKQR